MRTRLLHLVTMVGLFAAFSRPAIAQEAPAQQVAEDNAKVSQLASPAPKHYYKLNFVLRETDDGKVVNHRAFTMNVAADAPQTKNPMWWTLRSGTRVPVPDTKGGTNYVDVGVTFDRGAFA